MRKRSNRYSAARLTPLWPCQSAACSLYGRPLNIPTQTKCACSVSSLERDSELVCRVRYYSGEELNKDSSKELGRCAEFPTLADASSTARAALLYMTVCGNKRELLGAELLGISGHLPTYSSLQKRTAWQLPCHGTTVRGPDWVNRNGGCLVLSRYSTMAASKNISSTCNLCMQFSA